MSEWFDKNIRKPIDLFSHPVWFILRNEQIDCTCKNFTTKDTDKCCPICFGTGKKVSLARVKAGHQNSRISLRGSGMGFSEIDVVNVYYTFQQTSIKEGDMVVDGPDVDIVKNVYYEHSDQQKVVYYRIETVPYKNPEAIKKTLGRILKEAGKNA